ncbi:hypothetical protein [Roseovarius amoyensis]|uniref:hypothetical protein n=1 Tax=Roseovarius amoyensis TaxID=2211448 RepID=UPI000DBE4EC4|nr:hypothetical protein [Roseovarius amoyensis]
MHAKLVVGGVTLIGADALRDGTMFPYRPPRGDDALTKYRFNDRRIRHLFCAACGVQSFARGTMPDSAEMVAITSVASMISTSTRSRCKGSTAGTSSLHTTAPGSFPPAASPGRESPCT